MPTVSPPPIEVPFFDENGNITEPWKKYLLSLRQALAAGAAPSDAAYLVAQANADLTNEIDLGSLANGWLRIAVTAGLATVSSLAVLYTAMEPSDDVTIPANMGAVVPDRLIIAAGKTLTIGPGAVLQIL
jgi:hypothetical protein